MQIKPISYNLSFKKTLVAKCNIARDNDGYMPASIHKIDPEEDKDYFVKLKLNSNWNSAEYLSYMIEELPYLRKKTAEEGYQIYSMEDTSGECIGFSEIFISDDFESMYVDILETAPKFRNNNKNSKLRYIGETFLSFFAKIAGKEKKENIKLFPEKTAYGFYKKKCFFDEADDSALQLVENDFKKLINQNEKHCGCEIVLM